MSVTRRRRRSSLLGVDPANVISSPTESTDAQSRRRSLRIRRSSCRFHSLPQTNDLDVTVSVTSTTCDDVEDFGRSSHFELSPVSYMRSPPTSPSYRSLFPTDKSDINENLTPSTFSSETFDHENSGLQVDPVSLRTMISSPPNWLKSHYTPPKRCGLEVLPEDRTLRFRRHPLKSNTSANSTLRLQVFTGQTIDEACLPKCPGGTPLDPKLVLSVTKQRVLLRQKKARRLGFKGVRISSKTERRMSQLMRAIGDSPNPEASA
ncbi:hypothetical protein P879_09806 [Paragonimus westermani]|uniref:Uncharacterized protein n=1 Tax=Paragonimus westermani TaxID=34504 RepID=A0A8T0D5I3_9TREM|nr:hypothetical protein P879_09806 [Paragonimus westermani]